MNTNRLTSTQPLTREQEREASRMFGKHVSRDKALALFAASTLCCLLPMLLGLRLWEAIPPIVETGLTGPEGKDDSLPRAVLVFGVPGLFALLNLISHAQLWLHQRRETLPPVPIRMFGRWTLPVLSVLLSARWISRAAGESVTGESLVPALLALLLLLAGSHFFDCRRESKFAFHFKIIEYKKDAWQKTHRAASLAWMAAGLLLLAVWFGTGRLPWYTAALSLLLLLAPIPAAGYYAKYNEY